jgi:transporter family-2 protein
MDQGIGSKETIFITFAGGGIFASVMMIAARGGHLHAWQNVPWYALTAGALGLLIVGTIGYTVPRLGLTTALTMLVASQLVAAVVLDHFGILGATVRTIDLPRIAGLTFLVVGAWLVLK